MTETSTHNEKKIDIEQRRSEIENTIQHFQRLILERNHRIEDLVNSREKELDKIFKELLNVVDAFNKADTRLVERYPDSSEVASARNRFATAKNRLMAILENNGVSEIQFPDGLATIEDCQVEETQPDNSKPDGTILSIEKAGYRRNGRLLRLAEVVVVRN